MFIPGAQNIIRSKDSIRWMIDGENGDEQVLNRPINDVTDMVLTLKSDAILSDPTIKGLSEQTIYKDVHFNGQVFFDGGSSSDDVSIAMAIALG